MSCSMQRHDNHLRLLRLLLARVEHLGEGRHETDEHAPDEDVEDSAHAVPLQRVRALRLKHSKATRYNMKHDWHKLA